MRTVSEVARLAAVSVRTLHHYDEIGLLSPKERSDSEYRLYGDSDLERLQSILFYRELGFGLEQIAQLLDAPGFSRQEALMEQRALLEKKTANLMDMIASIDASLLAMKKGNSMSAEEMFDVFGDFDPAEYEDEAKERWGDTDAYKESARRTARYKKQEWEQIANESAATNEAFAALMAEGVAPGDPRSMDLAEEARLHIDRWFYPCTREMHVGLGDTYVADPRFTATYDKVAPGLAKYICAAIKANAER